MSTTDPVLKSLIQECRDALGFNYTLMMHRFYVNYVDALQKKNALEAAEAASKMTEAILQQQFYSLHSRVCEKITEDILSIEFVPALTDLFRQLALSYDIQTKYSQADEVYEKSFALLEPYRENGSDKITWYYASMWYNRAQHSRKGETREILTAYTQKALEYYEAINDKHGISLCYNHLATLLPEDMMEEKITLLKQIVALRVNDNAPTAISLAEINIGFYEIKKGNMDFGVNLMRESVKIIERYANKRYAALANLHFAKGLLAANRPYDARNACNYAGELFKANAIQAHLPEYESLLAEIEKAIKQSES